MNYWLSVIIVSSLTIFVEVTLGKCYTLLCWCVSISLSETTADLLPRLYQIKYDSGTLEELLYVDMPHEYQNPSGHIILLYAKAIQQCIFEQLHIVRDGQLRIVFTLDLKVCWACIWKGLLCLTYSIWLSMLVIISLLLIAHDRFTLGSFVLGITKSEYLDEL